MSFEKGIAIGVFIVLVIIIGGILFLNEKEITGPEIIVDRTVNLEGGHFITYNLGSGEYRVDIDSDDDLRIKFIGGDVGDQADAEDVRSYHRNVDLYSSGTLKIGNPSGILSNPTATIQIKIVKER